MSAVIKLKLGWEEALAKLFTPHSGRCKCGCKRYKRELRSRVKEISTMVAEGKAVIV